MSIPTKGSLCSILPGGLLKEKRTSWAVLIWRWPNSTKPFQVTIAYIVNDSSLNYTGNEIILPENNLRILEGQLRGAYQLYTFVSKGSPTYIIYGFPTASDIMDYTKHNGQNGRLLNVLGVVKGKGLFLLSYSNNKQGFYKLLPVVSEITKSIVILK